MIEMRKETGLLLAVLCWLSPGLCPATAAPNAKPAVKFDGYLSDVQRRVMKDWSPPGTRQPRTVEVDFKINKYGTESHLQVSKSSGDDAVDSAALKTINDAAPFNELPEGSPSEVDVDIAFYYNVLKDKGTQLKTVAKMPGVAPQLVLERVSEPIVDFGPYMADLQRRIKRAWFPPKGEESRRVVVVFKVDAHGRLLNLKLTRSSGVRAADQQALKAVEGANPFQPLPQGAPKDVDVQFTFDYNVFGGESDSPPAGLPPAGLPPAASTSGIEAPVAKELVELNNEGVKAINADNLVLAIQKLEQAVELNPAYRLAKENLAIAYNNNGLKLQKKPIEALDQFHKALYIKPDNVIANQNLDGIVASMGKDPKAFKDRVRLAEDALKKNDRIGGFVEYKQALTIQEDPVVRAKFDEIARVLDPNYRPVAITGSTNGANRKSDRPPAVAPKPASSLALFIPGWALMLSAMAVVFALGLYLGTVRQDQAVDLKNAHRRDHGKENT